MTKCLELLGYESQGGIGSFLVLGSEWPVKLRRLVWAPIRYGYIVGIDSPVEVARSPVQRILRRVRPSEYVSAHVGYTADLLHDVLKMDFQPILIIRDPRAVLASFVPYVLKERTHPLHDQFRRMNPEECYLAALNGHFSCEAPIQPLRIRCMALAPWIDSDEVLTVKFEELTGSKGGGSDTLQKKTVSLICDWLDAPHEKIDNVCKNLFGAGTRTFRVPDRGSVNPSPLGDG